MSDDSKRNDPQKKMEFFGAVTASVSHEINNVLAIMNENSGLMGDLLKSAGRNRPIDIKKFQKINDKLGAQIDRGKHIVKKLNRFAHSVDTPTMEIDLNEVITNFCDISQRFAYRKKVELTLSVKKVPIMIETRPFSLQQMVFYCINTYLSLTQPGDEITIKVRKDSEGAVVLVYGPRLDAPELFDALEPLKNELGAKTEAEKDGAKILIFLPRSVNN